MKFAKLAIASIALLGGISAQATVVGTLGTAGGSFLTLSSTGNLGGLAQFSGGVEILGASDSIDTMPVGTQGEFASVRATQDAHLTFTSGVSYLSFLWGSPDTYNRLTITETNGTSKSFTAGSLGLSPTNGTGAGQYVQFTDVGSSIKSLTYSNEPDRNSFETSNYSITAVPEPETYALMLGGLGVIGFVARRRRA